MKLSDIGFQCDWCKKHSNFYEWIRWDSWDKEANAWSNKLTSCRCPACNFTNKVEWLEETVTIHIKDECTCDSKDLFNFGCKCDYKKRRA